MKDSRRLRLSIGPVLSSLEGPAPAADLIERFSVARGGGRSRDTFRCFRADQTFYTGLVPEVTASLKEAGIGVEVHDARTLPSVTRDWTLGGATPRAYQEAVANRLASHPLSLVRLPSAAGKTIAALAALRRVGASRALYLSDRLDLAFQFADVARDCLGIKPGFVGAGRFEIDSPLVAASVDSALSRVEDLGPFDLTIADEAHSAAAPTYFDLVERVGSYRRLGLTATPFRRNASEEVLLRALFGPPVQVAELSELQTAGFVARPALRMIPVEGAPLDLTLVWQQLEEELVHHPSRNRLVVREAVRLAREAGSALVLVRLVRHGEILRDLFRAEGHDAPLLTGAVSAQDRHKTLTAFRDSKGGILIGTEVMAVGVDVPRLGGLVLACGQHAKTATLQKVGRVMRVSPEGGSSVRQVVDFDDARLHPLLGQHSAVRRRWMAEELGIHEERPA